jgi:DNA polymerase III subunit gamma/tau
VLNSLAGTHTIWGSAVATTPPPQTKLDSPVGPRAAGGSAAAISRPPTTNDPVAYQVLARKWRPQSFTAVVGQDAITQTLRNALASGRLAHAYLFAGPRGIGKTTMARLLAKALLCPERKAEEPCGTCPVCQEVQAGATVDVIEIDGASNRGIDDIRTLRENVKYAPARGRYKVYIIDEVHQLTPQAFDALLKTLEEPPAHVVFVLATTDPREIPLTVLSRVQRFDFKPIPPDIVSETLRRILIEEGVTHDPAALPIIARAATGSLRDALSLLDTALAHGGGTLEAAATAQVLGTAAPAQVRALVEAMLAHDAARALEAIDRAAAEGDDLGALARETIELMRHVLVLKAAPAARFAGLAPAAVDDLLGLGQGVSLDEILYLLRAFLDADAEMRDSPHPRVELEIAAVRAARRPVPAAIEDILRRVDEAEARARQTLLSGPAAPRSPAQTELLGGGSGPAPSTSPPHRGRDDRRVTAAAPASSVPAANAVPAGGPGGLAEGWALVVADVMRKKAMLGSVVNQAAPVELTDGVLTVRLEGNQFHRELLSDRANREIVTEATRRHVTGAVRIEIVGGIGDPGATEEHPAVRAALERFGGEIVSVRPRPQEGEAQ